MSGGLFGFPSLPGLLNLARSENGLLFCQGGSTGKSYYRADFQQDVQRVFSYVVKSEARYVALYTESSYWFCVGFVASLLAGTRVSLLPNKQENTLALLESQQLLLSDIESLFSLGNGVNLRDCSVGAEAKNLLPQHLDSSKSIIEIFTSGSTGEAKRVIKTLANFEAEIATLERLWGELIQDRAIIASVSHQHVYGVLFRIMWPLYSGRVFADGLVEYPEQLDLYDADKVVLISSPALLKRIQDQLSLNLPKVVYSSGGPLDEVTNIKLCDRFGVAVWEVFGSTETGGVAVRSLKQKRHWTLMPGVAASSNDEGILQITSPHAANGHQVMGDKVEFVTEAEFNILGRSDRVIKLEEKRVSLTAVEQHLIKHNGVQSAHALVLSGNRDMLAVVVELNASGSALLKASGVKGFKKEIKQWLGALLEPVTLPRRIRFVSEMPLTSQGKLDRLTISRLFEDVSSGSELPEVLSSEVVGSKCRLNLIVPEDCVWFKGHFDQAPILSGVAQMDWVMTMAQQFLHIKESFIGVEVLKFQNIIQPKDEFTLELEYLLEKQKLVFSMVGANEKPLSSGRIVLTNEGVS